MADFFEGEDQSTGASEETKDFFEELVGEGKKFKTPQDLAKGKVEADAFIQKIQDENAALKEELEKAQKDKAGDEKVTNVVEEVRKALAEGRSEEGKPPLSEDALASKVESILNEKMSAQTRKDNFSKARELVLGKVGGDVEAAEALVAERSKELGMSAKELRDLSERSPNAFARLIGVEPKGTGSTSTSSIPGQNTQTPSSDKPLHVDGVPTKAYFDQKRKEMGVRKWMNDKQLQLQYLDAAKKLGPKFNV